MKVNVSEFLQKYASAEYKHGIYIPEDIFFECSNLAFRKPSGIIELPDNIIDVIEENKRKHENREVQYGEISSHRLAAMDKEKDDIEAAIDEFAKSIELGEKTTMFHAYAHSYERIIILLHKVKEYEREAFYISQYLKHDIGEKQRVKYTSRLEKLKLKLK